eukprot:PhF_6_TR25771/c0_g1_i1/m.36345
MSFSIPNSGSVSDLTIQSVNSIASDFYKKNGYYDETVVNWWAEELTYLRRQRESDLRILDTKIRSRLASPALSRRPSDSELFRVFAPSKLNSSRSNNPSLQRVGLQPSPAQNAQNLLNISPPPQHLEVGGTIQAASQNVSSSSISIHGGEEPLENILEQKAEMKRLAEEYREMLAQAGE